MAKAKTTTKKVTTKSTPIYLLTKAQLKPWLKTQPAATKQWIATKGFDASAGSHCLISDASGKLSSVIIGAGDSADMWSIADISTRLPKGHYQLANAEDIEDITALYLGYMLGRYQFTAFKKAAPLAATLTAPKAVDQKTVKRLADSIYLARDLINRPANDLTPKTLTAAIKQIGTQYKATVKVTSGKELEKEYPAIHAVGKASDTPPALVDLRWGNAKHPKVTLVGKGVCFDSGGLDIKTRGMALMKKDMGGAASAIATAKAIMDAKLPVRLRLMIPAVENAIAGNAMRPSDIINTRKGSTVEIGNTDAEGRLILCDALTEADKEKPDLLIDYATLTGAARVALGTDVPAFFTDSDDVASQLNDASTQASEPLWRMPLHKPYAKYLDSSVADINNQAASGYGGAITAALFLKHFVATTPNWVHIDMMGWNIDSNPGRPKGGEAHAVRSVYTLIKNRYTKSKT